MSCRYAALQRLDLLMVGALLLLTASGGLAVAASATLPRGTLFLELALLCGGLACVLVTWLFYRGLLIHPLRRIAGGIRTMQRTGRLHKFPVRFHNELEVVAAGFNQLAEQVGGQKRRLREQIAELERVNAELNQLAALKDEFLETINHQLRTPVTAVVESVELMRDGVLGPLTEQQQAFVRTIDENVTRLACLIEEVVDLALLKSGRRPLERQPGDLAALLRRTQASWQAMTQTCTVRMSCAELPPVYMDAQAIQEVMDHLLRNALRHAPKPSEIAIEAHARDGVAEVSVRDQGPGLSREQLTRLFEPFSHVHTPEAPGSQGSGLGLAFCRQVIERHRGAIRAESSQGHGTTFTFSLPVASASFQFEEACRRAQEDAEYEHGQFGILLASPAPAGLATMSADELMRHAETVLRRQTHHGDQFVWLDELAFVIVAVADQAGMDAMGGRLQAILREAQLYVHLASAVYPIDGKTPQQLLQGARRQSPESSVPRVPAGGNPAGDAAVAAAPNGVPRTLRGRR